MNCSPVDHRGMKLSNQYLLQVCSPGAHTWVVSHVHYNLTKGPRVLRPNFTSHIHVFFRIRTRRNLRNDHLIHKKSNFISHIRSKFVSFNMKTHRHSQIGSNLRVFVSFSDFILSVVPLGFQGLTVEVQPSACSIPMASLRLVVRRSNCGTVQYRTGTIQ